MRKPPPPMLPALGWVTARANAVATAASTALPPSHSASTPAWVARKFWLTTIPLRARAGTVAAERAEAVARAVRTVESRSFMLPFYQRPAGQPMPVIVWAGLPGMSVLPLIALLAAAASPPATLRLDYFHTGDAKEERFALHAVVREGPWPGPADRRLDPTNLGRYLFEVRDARSGELLYSRGSASVAGAWASTLGARARPRGV